MTKKARERRTNKQNVGSGGAEQAVPKELPPARQKMGQSAKAANQGAVAMQSRPSRRWHIGAVIISIIVGYGHYAYLWRLFENERHFSHLATIERDISFRTEQGLYYSYYKSIIHAPTFSKGIHDVLHDTVTEHPSTFNVLKRFNLWPEVATAASYRLIVQTIAERWLKLKTMECWMINRGEGKSQVRSCEGWGDEHYYYVNHVFALNGFVLVGGIFYLGTMLSGTYWAGGLSTLMYMFNHGECTRCMWTPPLREQWSFPFLPLQIYMVITMLRSENKSPSHSQILKLASISAIFMVSWQFAQFALFTQTASIVAVYLLDLSTVDQTRSILTAQLLSILANYLIQFGNEMLLTSFGFSSILVAFAIVHAVPLVHYKLGPIHPLRIIKIGIFMASWLFGTYGVKSFITGVFGVQDDAHIFDILRSKFTNFATFHTRLYTCAKEFDFLEPVLFAQLCGTGLGIFVAILLVRYAWQALRLAFQTSDGQCRQDWMSGAELYLAIQTVAFTILATLIMRLKLFMVPLMCLLAGLVLKPGVLATEPKNLRRVRIAIVLVCLLGSNPWLGGIRNIKKELSRMGSFENLHQEQMLEWVMENTERGHAVFAGAMPIMATIKHVANRSIVNHPHYENQIIRDRTYEVYSVYSRRPIDQIYKSLKALEVTYLIYEHGWCTRSTAPGCAMVDLYDIHEPEYGENPTHCKEFNTGRLDKKKFKSVFKNEVFRIYRVF